MEHFRSRRTWIVAAICLTLADPSFGAVPPGEVRTPGPRTERIKLSPFVAGLLKDHTLSEAERRRLTIFHGQWNMLDEWSAGEQGGIALQRFDLSHDSLSDPRVAPLVRAEAALRRGDPETTLNLLEGDHSSRATVRRAEAHIQLGQLPEAIEILRPWRDALANETIEQVDELVAAARTIVLLARLEGRASQDYKLAMGLFSRAHQELDRLYWPAKLAEAELLFEKDNAREALVAAREALVLNPRAGRAWYLLGRLGLGAYNFNHAARAVKELRRINRTHLLADLLETRMLLQQKDAAGSARVIGETLSRYPRQREALALKAAAEALSFDEAGLSRALAVFDGLSPKSALAPFTVGRYLSRARQYGAGEKHLRAAIALEPNWPGPRLELGLLLMQSGHEEKARVELRQATTLDPFNRAVANQLRLVEDLLDFEHIRTEHFVIKYRKGIDEALARDMPEPLERIYDDVTGIYGYEPPGPTLIEIMPDKQWFAVRITGMPEIWTIGACTGNVIALVPPRAGPRQHGSFDWENVIRHEFVHTVTLNQTGFRIPHWFTEACAVSQENTDRDYTMHQLLAKALHEDRLFNLDRLNWAFVRPKTPQDRPLAYAQSHWMIQYIIETHGHGAVVRMLDLYRGGSTNIEAIKTVTGRSAEQFMNGFLAWASRQVKSWGLDPTYDPRIEALLTERDDPNEDLLRSLLSEFPDHPDLLRLAAERAVAGPDYGAARQAVLRFAAVRPVDPWSGRALVRLALRHDRVEDAVGPLEQLDRNDVRTADWAEELARIHRAAGHLDRAAEAAQRALRREPYDATRRELAAAIELQRGRPEAALHHIRALTVLEPDRSHQWVRLTAVYHKIGRTQESREAARKARELDPRAPVTEFLDSSD